MNATQQHMIDAYRTARRGEAPPPPPGDHDLRTIREAWTYRRFRAVLAGRRVCAAAGGRAAC
ncbi:hypothetical protein ABZ070_35925 [Streptomyces sp. NPDC006283]|uniref:hypothetical protein n=1 Tax=Streptomyces sp. NPDC006283 TaxID=3156741 RepID=UPI0033B943A1